MSSRIRSQPENSIIKSYKKVGYWPTMNGYFWHCEPNLCFKLVISGVFVITSKPQELLWHWCFPLISTDVSDLKVVVLILSHTTSMEDKFLKVGFYGWRNLLVLCYISKKLFKGRWTGTWIHSLKVILGITINSQYSTKKHGYLVHCRVIVGICVAGNLISP